MSSQKGRWESHCGGHHSGSDLQEGGAGAGGRRSRSCCSPQWLAELQVERQKLLLPPIKLAKLKTARGQQSSLHLYCCTVSDGGSQWYGSHCCLPTELVNLQLGESTSSPLHAASAASGQQNQCTSQPPCEEAPPQHRFCSSRAAEAARDPTSSQGG